MKAVITKKDPLNIQILRKYRSFKISPKGRMREPTAYRESRIASVLGAIGAEARLMMLTRMKVLMKTYLQYLNHPLEKI